jgi:hypothetical protein
MSVQPLGSVIATPAIPPDLSQLPDIATVVDTNDPHLLHGGTYDSSSLCGPGVLVSGTDPCTHQDMQRGIGTVGSVTGYPGTVLTGAQCLGPVNLAELQADALRNSDVKINRTIQDNLIGLIPRASFTSRVAAKKYGAMGDAEAAARCEYYGRPVIHLHPRLADPWMGHQIIRVGRHLETVAGALISLNCNLADTEIAITGALTVFKGANRVIGPLSNNPATGAPGSNHTNLWFVSVKTSVTVFNDCNFAILLTGV